MSKKSRCRRPFEKQHGKRSQTLLKSARQQLYNIYWTLWRKVSREDSLLVICKILQRFVNTLTADDKYYLLNRDIFKQEIEMELSKKQKLFVNLFLHFWNLDQIFNIFDKKMTIVANLFPRLRTAKDVARYMSKISRFRRPFNKQPGKRSQTQLKSAWQRLYNI